MKILGIESSCDETAASVVEDGVRVLSNKIASQIEIHARYGGVVPEVASRQHMLAMIPIIRQAMDEAEVGWEDLDAIAVTKGPGLAGSLLVGVNTAKAIALARKKPLIGVNHLEGHIYANWLTGQNICFPVICLIVSGGHSDLVLMKDHGDYTLLGQTRDDAAGEAFDKAARILGLGYPGGPADTKSRRVTVFRSSGCLMPGWKGLTISASAASRRPCCGWWREAKSLWTKPRQTGYRPKYDAAASFQKAVVEVLVTKTISLAKERGVSQILVAGGVAANSALRRYLVENSPIPVLIPPIILCTDNAAMIAACGYYRYRAGQVDGLDMDAIPSLKLA